MNRIVMVLTMSFPLFGADGSQAEEIKINTEKSTSIMACTKEIGQGAQKSKLAITVVTSTKSEKICKIVGDFKFKSMKAAGWNCTGRSVKDAAFECNEYTPMSYSHDFSGPKFITFDRLNFTDLDGNETTINFYNRGSGPICDAFKADIEKSGIKDAKCTRRSENDKSKDSKVSPKPNPGNK